MDGILKIGDRVFNENLPKKIRPVIEASSGLFFGLSSSHHKIDFGIQLTHGVDYGINQELLDARIFGGGVNCMYLVHNSAVIHEEFNLKKSGDDNYVDVGVYDTNIVNKFAIALVTSLRNNNSSVVYLGSRLITYKDDKLDIFDEFDDKKFIKTLSLYDLLEKDSLEVLETLIAP